MLPEERKGKRIKKIKRKKWWREVKKMAMLPPQPDFIVTNKRNNISDLYSKLELK